MNLFVTTEGFDASDVTRFPFSYVYRGKPVQATLYVKPNTEEVFVRNDNGDLVKGARMAVINAEFCVTIYPNFCAIKVDHINERKLLHGKTGDHNQISIHERELRLEEVEEDEFQTQLVDREIVFLETVPTTWQALLNKFSNKQPQTMLFSTKERRELKPEIIFVIDEFANSQLPVIIEEIYKVSRRNQDYFTTSDLESLEALHQYLQKGRGF